MVTVFILIMNQMEIHLGQNRFPFNVKGDGDIVFSMPSPNSSSITTEICNTFYYYFIINIIYLSYNKYI